MFAATGRGGGRGPNLMGDLVGDWREEIIVWNGDELHIYGNTAPNPRPKEKRKWTVRNYRRLKQCHNYYSP